MFLHCAYLNKQFSISDYRRNLKRRHIPTQQQVYEISRFHPRPKLRPAYPDKK